MLQFLCLLLLIPAQLYGAAQPKNTKLYEMDRSALLKESSSSVLQEITILEEKQKEDLASLDKLKKLNQALCQRLQQLESQCPAMYFIADSYGMDDLGCNGSKTTNNKLEMTVELKNDHGNSFMLMANDKYVSSEINAQNMNQPITFKRIDSRLVKPPRLRDLTGLYILTVKKGGTYGERVQRPEDLAINIRVQGKNLLDDFTLLKPEEEIDTSSFRINPKGILELRTKKECMVELSEINQMIGK